MSFGRVVKWLPLIKAGGGGQDRVEQARAAAVLMLVAGLTNFAAEREGLHTQLLG